MNQHIWENDEYRFIQTLDERGHIIDVERLPVAELKQLADDVRRLGDRVIRTRSRLVAMR